MDSALVQVYLVIDRLLAQLGIATAGMSSGVQQGILIIIGVFFVTLLLGLTRHHMLSWSMKGAGFGVVAGMLLTLVLEGLLLVGGKTAVAEIVRNESAPPAVRVFLQKNMSELADLIGPESTTLGTASVKGVPEGLVTEYKKLTSQEQTQVRNAVCAP